MAGATANPNQDKFYVPTPLMAGDFTQTAGFVTNTNILNPFNTRVGGTTSAPAKCNTGEDSYVIEIANT